MAEDHFKDLVMELKVMREGMKVYRAAVDKLIEMLDGFNYAALEKANNDDYERFKLALKNIRGE